MLTVGYGDVGNDKIILHIFLKFLKIIMKESMEYALL